MRHPRSETPRRRRVLLGSGLVLATLWAGGATAALLFRDDLMAGLLARQDTMQAAYEARLAELRETIEAARREREEVRDGLERRLATALDRQDELERRHAVLRRLPEATDPGLPEARPEPAGPSLRGADGLGRRSERVTPERIALLETALDAVQARQTEALGRVALRAAGRMQRLRAVIRGAGLDAARLGETAPAPVGGPFVPLTGDVFAEALEGAQRALDDAERLKRRVGALPLQRPILGPSSVSSGFGARLDPFTHGFALHTGLDLKAQPGEPVRATAPGRVSAAEFAGGYGNMVEIDHGQGLVTRFAHLGQIAVSPGQFVAAGALVGRVGSTGRSTGAHLHYEVRIDGEPVDPQRFLDAGRRLAAAAL